MDKMCCPDNVASLWMTSLAANPVFIFQDEDCSTGLEDLLRVSGLHSTETITSQQGLMSRLSSQEGNRAFVLVLSRDDEAFSSLLKFTHPKGIPALVPVLETSGKLVLKLNLGQNIRYGCVNCGVFNPDGRRVHVGATSCTTDNNHIVTCDRQHGLETGDVISFTEDEDQEVIVEAVISAMSFMHTSSQAVKQGCEVNLVRRKDSLRSSTLSNYKLGDERIVPLLEDPEVLGFIGEQVVRALLSPGLALNPSTLAFSPLQTNNLVGSKLLVTGAGFLSLELLKLLSRIELDRLVFAVGSHLTLPTPLYNDEARRRVQVETVEYSDSTQLEEFDLIICCSGDYSSRISLGDRCVEAQKPLIMLAQDSLRGQLESFVPHATVSYSCLRDPSDPEPPNCILKSFPYRDEHAAQWAYEKVNRMLFHKPQARDTFIQEHKSNLENLARKLSSGVPEGSRETEFFRDSVGPDPTWEKCLIAARIKFEKYFSHKASQLVSTFPPDYTVTDGSLFWSWPKLRPRPVLFDPSDPIHAGFVEALAQGLATLLGVPVPEQSRIVSIVSNLELAPFVSKNKEIVTDESASKESAPVELGDRDFSGLVKYISHAEPSCAQPSQQLLQKLTVFVTYLRCDMYGIPRPQADEVTLMVEKRQTCLSVMSLQLAKLGVNKASELLGGGKAESMWLCGGEKVVYQTPDPVRTQITPQLSTTVWDIWEMRGSPQLTLQQFMDAVLAKHSVKISLVCQGTRMVYMPNMPTHKNRLGKPMVQLLKNPKNDPFVPLTLMASADGDGEDISLPQLRYYF